MAALYTDLLNRAPTDSEQADGVAELNAGTPLSTLISTIMTSDEYLKDEVDADYTIYLGRPATPANERQGIAALRRESSERFLASLLGSRVYFVNHPGATAKEKEDRRDRDREVGKDLPIRTTAEVDIPRGASPLGLLMCLIRCTYYPGKEDCTPAHTRALPNALATISRANSYEPKARASEFPEIMHSLTLRVSM